MASKEQYSDALSDSDSDNVIDYSGDEQDYKDTDSQVDDDLRKNFKDCTVEDDPASRILSDYPDDTPTPLRREDFVDDEELKIAERALSNEQLKENKEKAEKLKAEANELFKNGEYEESAKIYTSALVICPVDYCPAERAILYANRAAAKMKLDSKASAIEDCTKALEFNPDYIKALMRRAKLYEDSDKLDESLNDWKKVSELDPSNNEARQALIRLPPLINERNEKLKTEMLGKLKDLGNMILKPFGLSTNNFQMQQDPNTGSYSVNFTQNQN